jgi:uncharacterized protein (DUF58 family)
LQQRLVRTRLLAGDAVARGGVGERRSLAKGEGIEFEDHRPYEVGDDLRRLDPHLFARFGEPFVRQFTISQQLPVTVLLDASRSMAAGEPSKLTTARAIAFGLALVALAGSDAVRTAVLSDGRINWQTRQSGLGRLPDLEAWLNRWLPAGGTDLAAAVATMRSLLQPRGLTVVISDLWSDSALEAIDALVAAGQSLVIVHILAPEELRPDQYGSGAMRLVDSETNEEIEVTIGADQVAQYRRILAAWVAQLRQRVLVGQGRFVQVRSDDDIEELFVRTFPQAGILR